MLVQEFKAIYERYLSRFLVHDVKWYATQSTLSVRYFEMEGLVEVRWRIRRGFVLEDTKQLVNF